MPDELDDVVDRILDAIVDDRVPGGTHENLKRELRAVQAATWREAAGVLDELYERWSKRSYPPPEWVMETANELRARAAALHPKESTDE